GSVNAKNPRSCKRRLPAGKGDGVASAIGLSWVRPPDVSLRKRMTSRALSSRTFLTVWSLFSCRYNSLAVQQGLGCRRCVVPSRQGHKGGVGRDSGYGDDGGWFLLQRADNGGGGF